MNGRRGRRGRDGPSRGTTLRLALLAGIVAVPGVELFGTGALRESVAALRTGQTSGTRSLTQTTRMHSVPRVSGRAVERFLDRIADSYA